MQLGEGDVTYKARRTHAVQPNTTRDASPSPPSPRRRLPAQVSEQLQADLVGLSDFTYNEPVPCGRIRFLDTAEGMSKNLL